MEGLPHDPLTSRIHIPYRHCRGQFCAIDPGMSEPDHLERSTVDLFAIEEGGHRCELIDVVRAGNSALTGRAT